MERTDTMVINGEEWVRKAATPANVDGMEYSIVRTYSAGVFAGYIKDRNGKEVTLLNARRLWYWDGAASLSELAMKGVSKPGNCKFPCEVPSIILTEVIEILPCTEDAKKSIADVPEWTAR